MKKLIIMLIISGFASSCYCSDDLTDKEKEQVSCETQTVCVKPKIVYRDRIVEKIVYKDRIVEKPVEKIVYREKPVISYVEKKVDKIVYKDRINTKIENGGKLNLSLLAGMGKNGLYSELDEATDEYTMYSAWGAIIGVQGVYRFDNNFTVGLGATSNETVFGSFGYNFF